MVTIIYPTFFMQTCDKLLSQNRTNYDKNIFYQIENSIKIAKYTVIGVTSGIEIGLIVANAWVIYRANVSKLTKWIFVLIDTIIAAGIALVSAYVYNDIEKIQNLSKQYQSELQN